MITTRCLHSTAYRPYANCNRGVRKEHGYSNQSVIYCLQSWKWKKEVSYGTMSPFLPSFPFFPHLPKFPLCPFPVLGPLSQIQPGSPGNAVSFPRDPGGTRPTSGFWYILEFKITLLVIALWHLQQFADNNVTKFCKTRDVFFSLSLYLSSRHIGMVFLGKEVAVCLRAESDQGTAGIWHTVTYHHTSSPDCLNLNATGFNAKQYFQPQCIDQQPLYIASVSWRKKSERSLLSFLSLNSKLNTLVQLLVLCYFYCNIWPAKD